MIALCLPAFAEKVILGKLGQALAQTPIFSRPTTRARVYYKVKPYEYLVLQSANNDKYFKVLLENGSYGYVSSEAVARLPYNVTADRNSPMRDIGSVSSRSRAALASYSLNYEGTPYVWGGNDPQRGIDCSGFVKYLYGKIGINLPRTAAQQVHVGQRITRLEDLKAGDRLYFWSSKRNMIGHTGMYLGNGYFVHSSTNHHGVATDYLATPKWLNMLVAARR
jgi:cell wall-associated NlpC family hydrolase